MLLQTNSYVVPKEKRAEHARLMRRFRQVLNRLGCNDFEVYEQVGANWGNTSTTGRFVQIMRFRDRKHQLAVQTAERSDPAAQELIAEFCDLVNYPEQQQQGQFAVGFYSSVLPISPPRPPRRQGESEPDAPPSTPPTPDAPASGTAAAAAAGVAGFGAAAAMDDAADELLPPAEFGGASLRPLTESEQELAADEFAQEATRRESADEVIDADTPALPDTEPPADLDEPALPTLETDTPFDEASPDELAPDSLPESAEATPPHAAAIQPEQHTPVESAEPPAEAPKASDDDFDLDDLNLDDDLGEITDDDLARLAQELSDEPGRNGNGGTPGPSNPR